MADKALSAEMESFRQANLRQHRETYEKQKRLAAQISDRTDLDIVVPAPYDFEAAEKGRDPLPDAFRKATAKMGKGYRDIGVACRLGPSCETWAIAMEKLVSGELGLPYVIELPPSLEIVFRVRFKRGDAAKVRNAFERLAAKFGAHLNVYYSGSEPWGMDVSKSIYYHD